MLVAKILQHAALETKTAKKTCEIRNTRGRARRSLKNPNG